MLKSSLCDYSDAYILGKGRITITGTGDDTAARQANFALNASPLKIIKWMKYSINYY